MRIISILIVILIGAVMAQPAEARKRSTDSEEISHVAGLPDNDIFTYNGQPVDLGHIYTLSRVVIIPTWAAAKEDGFVLYAENDDGYFITSVGESEWTEIAKALGRDPRDGYRFPWWKHGWGGLLIGILILLGLFQYLRRKWRRRRGR